MNIARRIDNYICKPVNKVGVVEGLTWIAVAAIGLAFGLIAFLYSAPGVIGVCKTFC